MVQTSSLFVNKVLPSGSGALGLSYLYLRSNKVDKLSAASLVALNNIIGFLGHATLLLIVLVVDRRDVEVPDFKLPEHLGVWVIGVLCVVLLAIMVFGLRRKKGQKKKWSSQLRRTLRSLKNPKRALGALGTSMLLTLCYVACLAIAAHGLNVQLSFPTVLIALSVSVFATSVIPSPGGIGASEAGMFVALRAYDIAAGPTLAVAILYRVMTFWLPMILGVLAYLAVEKNKLVSYKL
jgi:uncharacterized membrane protein YbhN (UPF0104 family)